MGQLSVTSSWTPPYATGTGQRLKCKAPDAFGERILDLSDPRLMRFRGVYTQKIRRTGVGMKSKWGHLWQWHLRCLSCAFSKCWPCWQTLLPSMSQTVIKSSISAFWCLMFIISCRAAQSGGQSNLCLACRQLCSWSTDQLTAAPACRICLQKSISNNPTQRQHEAIC